MLSSLPQTQIHQRVFNPTSDEPNNFKWVVDDFSDAGKYQTWHDLLARVEQELNQIRSKFGSWKSSLASADDQREAINVELEQVQARIQAKAAESGAEAAKLESDISRVQTSLNMKEGEFRRAEATFRESEAKNNSNLSERRAQNLKEILPSEDSMMPTTSLRRAFLNQIFPDTTPPSQNCKKKLRGTKAPNPPKARPKPSPSTILNLRASNLRRC